MPVTVGSRIGPYEVVAALGAGGMGEVYRARDTNLGREVALKVLPESFAQDPERLARFEREAKTLASLNHPNIAIVHGLEKGTSEVGHRAGALVMELVEGPTLAERIVAGPIPLDEALAIARQLTDALDAAHELGIVHRDLKPANIKLRADGTVKVLDFGLAKIVEPVAASSSSLTLSPTITSPALMSGVGVLLGTAAYMSPEQARGRAVDKRADIWAFGCVLWEMLVGERLFKGEDITETLASVVKDEPQWDRAPAKVRPVLRACLERDPKKRLRDIADVWRLLVEEPVAPVSRSASRRWIGSAVAGVLVVAAFALGVERWRQPAPTAPAPIRFHVPFPQKTELRRSIHAVSLDGQRLVFVATDAATQQSRLWLHELDALDARPLPGTEGAIGTPFWSADSKTVVFATAGAQPMQTPNTLKKIAIAGGPALTLGMIPSLLRGGFWLPNGTIVVSVAGQPLFKMSSAGGTMTALTTMAKDESGHSYPALLSDGRHFIYLRGQGANRGAIHVGRLDRTSGAGDDPRVMDQSSNVVYVRSREAGRGFIVFADGDALLAAPFDEKTLRVDGEPLPVSQGVGRGINDPNYALISGAPSGTLIYQEAGALTPRQLTWFDRRGMPVGNVGEPGPYSSDLRLSPSGSRVAFSVRQGGRQEIWAYDFERGNRSRLVQNTGTNWAPVWSPDESAIIYTSSQNGPAAIYRISVSGGGGEERVADGTNTSDWSRDGRVVLFQRRPGQGGGLLLLPDPARGSGGTPIRLTDSVVPEEQARISPDGRLIAYVSGRSGDSEVYVRSFDPSASTRLGPEIHVSTDGGVAPKWRADGRELVYRANRGIMSVMVEPGPAPRLGQPQLLFMLPPAAAQWDMTPDGSRFLLAINLGDPTPPPFTVLINWQSAIGR